MTGDFVPDMDWDEEREETCYVDLLAPRTFYPAPTVFHVPEQCADPVAQHVRRASAAYWTDWRATIGALRAAIEALLTDQGVRRSKTIAGKSGKPGRRQAVPLHMRIEEFSAKEPEVAELLMAVKWLGNQGAHDGPELDREEVLDAFELVEHVIERVYVRSTDTLRRKAKAVTKRKGRPKAAKHATSAF